MVRFLRVHSYCFIKVWRDMVGSAAPADKSGNIDPLPLMFEQDHSYLNPFSGGRSDSTHR